MLNRRNLGLILKGTEGTLDRDLDKRGEAIAERANTSGSGKVDLSKGVSLTKPGDGKLYESEGYTGKRRYRNTVRSSRPVVVSESPLLRSIDAGRNV